MGGPPCNKNRDDIAGLRVEFFTKNSAQQNKRLENEVSNRIGMKKPWFFVIQMPDARRPAVAIATNFRIGKCDADRIHPNKTAKKNAPP